MLSCRVICDFSKISFIATHLRAFVLIDMVLSLNDFY